jgi:hypothetical protein
VGPNAFTGSTEPTGPTSDLRSAAIDEQLDAVHEAAVVGGEERGGLPDFRRFAQPAHRYQRRKMRKQTFLVLCWHEAAQARRANRTRADCVYADVASFQVEQP